MNLIKKIWHDENSEPPKNYLWAKGGKLFKYINGQWKEVSKKDSGNVSIDDIVKFVLQTGSDEPLFNTYEEIPDLKDIDVSTFTDGVYKGTAEEAEAFSTANENLEVSTALSTSSYGIYNVSVRPEYRPFTIESLGSGNITWALGDKTVQYSKNGGEWTTMDSETNIPVSNGDKVRFKGDNESYYVLSSGGRGIQSTANFKVSGNIMSLLDSQDYSTLEQVSPYAFTNLFRLDETLIDAENLILPATVLGGYCYNYMFYGCSNLVKGPKEIYATSIGGWACEYMFGNCESLTSAPALPTTNITERSCYKNMFDGCTSLTTAPELPAEILTTSAYQMMFQNCTNLNYVKCLATNPAGDGSQVYNPCSYWLYGVSPTGTFVKASGVTWPTGDSGIPSGWTVETATE